MNFRDLVVSRCDPTMAFDPLEKIPHMMPLAIIALVKRRGFVAPASFLNAAVSARIAGGQPQPLAIVSVVSKDPDAFESCNDLKGFGSRISTKYISPLLFSLTPNELFLVAKADPMEAWWVTPPTAVLPLPESISAKAGMAAATKKIDNNITL